MINNEAACCPGKLSQTEDPDDASQAAYYIYN